MAKSRAEMLDADPPKLLPITGTAFVITPVTGTQARGRIVEITNGLVTAVTYDEIDEGGIVIERAKEYAEHTWLDRS